MKKNICLFLAAVVGILICFTLASAYRTGGEFASDSKGGGNPARFSPNFAPKSGTWVRLSNNAVYNLDVTGKTAVKYAFMNTTSNTVLYTGRIKYGRVTRGTNAGLLPATSDTITVGKDVQTIGFANISSAYPGTRPLGLTIHWQ